ncbi:helix-turn-helix domain-containing protein [Geminisphaera colitermitum]|uniref:helix-turn-helix domain-containing protein n=1 Tax=Geminisphaera colitermitum TaxID=1148786 RepID=UPI00019653D4|nr:helix-turn-helix domain-containing protein [Geminisphaera colitermitum]
MRAKWQTADGIGGRVSRPAKRDNTSFSDARSASLAPARLVGGSEDPSSSEIVEALEAFQKATGLSVCVKLLPVSHAQGTVLGEVVAQPRFCLHLSRFCLHVKEVLKHNLRCRDCDLREVPERCDRERKIFVNTCHAGADEVIVPLFTDEGLAGVAFVGQFRTRADQPEGLPFLHAPARRRAVGLARMLGAFLGEHLRRPRFSSETSRGFRRGAIQAFLEKNARTNPSLGDLAKHLGLSPTRTTHAVREATGMSFVELRDALRLERARGLLQGTYYKVSHIAAECGFSSPQYFHRFFQQKAGMTPLAWRRRHRTEV